MTLLTKILLLFAGHALCDYPLQGDFLARGKNPWNPISGVPWFWCMFAHALIHAAMVLLITGNEAYALAELVIHFGVDCLKCDGAIGFNTDQTIHYTCKLLWAIL